MLKQCFAIIKKSLQKVTSFSIQELIVISSGSTDNTNSILSKYQVKNEYKRLFFPLIENERKGKSDAVNKILNHYQSDFLILIPADVSITFDSINNLVLKILSSHRIGVVSGRPMPNLENVNSIPLKYILNTIWGLHNKALEISSLNNINTHSSGELMIIKKGIVDTIPSDIINDDAYIAISARLNGYIVSYEANALVKIEVPTSINDYIIQRKRVLKGHKQLQEITKSSPSNFRFLLKNQFPLAMIILLRKIKSIKHFLGLLFAIIIELRLEIENQASKLGDRKVSRFNPIWTRVNSYNSDE